MLFLKNDYGQGAHPRVMQALVDTNLDYADGYGIDPYCQGAEFLIRKKIRCDHCQVHFLPGGTLTNLTALSAFLRPHESVISAHTGHICVHETGAIEATGHKVNHVSSPDGKLYPKDIIEILTLHEDEHFVRPKLVYLSNSTETGLFYTKEELRQLRNCCDEHNLLLYIDGARLAMALAHEENDVRFSDLPQIADAFYVGGTKNGLLFGEALVLVNPKLFDDFRFLLKQRGGMMAKGRLLGIQFQAIFQDDLYFRLGRHANEMAQKLAQGLEKKGYSFDQPPTTNMVFPIFPGEQVDQLESRVLFEGWKDFGDTRSIRLVTSWGTTQEEIEEFLSYV